MRGETPPLPHYAFKAWWLFNMYRDNLKYIKHVFIYLPLYVCSYIIMDNKRPGHEADDSPPSSGEVKECMELYLHSPIHLS